MQNSVPLIIHLFLHKINIYLAPPLCQGVRDTKMNMHYLSP